MANVTPADHTPTPFAISGASSGGELIVTLSGEIDLAARGPVETFVQLEVEAVPGRLVLDMSDVTFVDSTGLSMVIWASRTVASAGGDVVIRRPPAQFRRLLEMTGTDRLATIEPATET